MWQEFKLKNCKLDYPDLSAFTTSPWLCPLIFIIYRIIIALYTSVWSIIGGIAREEAGFKWFIFLTNWSYTFLNIHFIIGALLPAYYHYSYNHRKVKVLASDRNANDDSGKSDVQIELDDACALESKVDSPPRHSRMFVLSCKASWVIFTIAGNMAPLVTLMYWVFDYVPGKHVDGSNVNAHAVNTVLMFADVMLSNLPVRVFHLVYAIACGTTYVVFTAIYWAVGGTNHEGKPYIYAVMDYGGNPGLAIMLAILFVLVVQPLSQVFLYSLFRFRQWLVGR